MNVYTATIKEPNPIGNNYTIETSEYADPVAVALSSSSGNDGNSTSAVTYEAGQEVLCARVGGSHIILGTLPKDFGRLGNSGIATVQGTDLNTKATPESKFIKESLFSRIGENNNYGFGTTESLPGDNILRVPGGNSLKLLSGGINVLDSGTARVTTNSQESRVSIDCSSFSLNTGFGNLDISSDSGGGFSLDFKGNTDPSSLNPNRTGTPSPNVELRLDNGFKVVSGSGYGISVEPSGKVTIIGESLFLRQNGAEIPILGGSSSNRDRLETVSGEIVNNANRTLTSQSKGDIVEISGGDMIKTAGKSAKFVYNGPNPVQNPLVAVNPAGVFSKEEHVISGGSKKIIGSRATGGGKDKKEVYGDIHYSTLGNIRGGGSVVMDCSTAPGATANGAWNSISTAKAHLNTILPATPAIPTDGLPNPWAGIVPTPGGLNPSLSGYCRFYQLKLLVEALSGAIAPLSAAPGGTGIAGFVSSLPFLLLSVESKHNYENSLPV